MISTVKGLWADVLRPADGTDCTLRGVSSLHERLTITGTVDDGDRDPVWTPLAPHSQVFTPTEAAPEAWLYKRRVGRDVWAVVPACAARQGDGLRSWLSRFMFGNNFAHLCDSRLTEIVGFYGAVAIHDRAEDGFGRTAVYTGEPTDLVIAGSTNPWVEVDGRPVDWEALMCQAAPNDCDQCTGSPVPGAIVAMDTPEGIQACDLCRRFAGDLDAAQAVAATVGGTVTFHY